MQDRPTAAELLDAAADFLEREVMPELSGRRQFHVRVTVNVLRIVRRELDGEEDAVRAEWTRLVALLGEAGEHPPTFAALRERVRAMNADLSKAIRAGELDDRFDEVLEALRETVAEKVAIANPRWLAR